MHVSWCVNLSAVQSSHCILPRAHMPVHMHTPAAILALPMHTHTHTPLHTFTHTAFTPTHTPATLPAPPMHTLTPTYKYLQISIAHNCHNPYLQISANIHTAIVLGLHPYELLGITIKIQSNRVDNKRI